MIVKRFVAACLAMVMLVALSIALIGCKSGGDATESPEATAEQQKLGKSLINEVKKGD